jgi:cytochrome P450
LFIPFFVPVRIVIERVTQAFRDAAVVQIKGHPIRVYCLADPERVEQLYSDRQAGSTKLPWLLPRVKHVMGNGSFIAKGGEAYRQRRQKVQPPFRRSGITGFLQDVPPLVEKALDEWAALALKGVIFDSYDLLRQLMTRINMRMFLSTDLSDEEVLELAEETHFIEAEFVRSSPLAIPFPSNLRFRRLTSRLRSRMRRIVQERRASANRPNDLLSHLVELQDDGVDWSDNDVVDEILSIYFGANVTSTTLARAFFQLGTHPQIQEKIVEEKNALLGQGLDIQDIESLIQLPFGQNVFKEMVRLYPAVWGYPRWTDHALLLGGVPIPAKSLVIPMVYLLHRDPRFWTEPERFWPDRFERDDAPGQQSFTYLPFSAGPRTCLGKALAPAVFQLVITMILTRFRIVFCPRFAGDPEVDFGFGIQPRNEVRVRLESR